MSENPRRRVPLFYTPVHSYLFFVLSSVLVVVLLLLFADIVGLAFKTLFPGLGTIGILLLLTTCFLGSFVNIPLLRLRSESPAVKVRYLRAFRMMYPVPVVELAENATLIAVNLGGAVISTLASVYLLLRAPSNIPYAAVATLAVALIVKLVSKPAPGVGIISPSLVSPLAAALAVLVGSPQYHLTAYVAGTMGTLIGADLLNFYKIQRLGSSVVSIGGTGTFDGVFLSGILAVLLPL